jgi:type I restriction enzyme, S subunit
MNRMSEKPVGWELVRLGDFVITKKGKKPKAVSNERRGKFKIAYVNIKAFEKNIVNEYTDGVGCVFCEDGDFLMVWDGSRSGYIGRAIKGALGSTLTKLVFPGIVDAYAFYYLRSKFIEINTRAKGVGIPHVDPNLLWNYVFPLPPLPEQHRIVEKIEALFSELDNGVEQLKTAQQQLKVYRQAVLKWAFEGKLTEEWRKHHPELPTAEKLLEQIKVEREQQAKARGKKLKQNPLLTKEELAGLPGLPQNWKWTKLNEVTFLITDGTHLKPTYMPTGVPFLSVINVRPGLIRDKNLKYITQEQHAGYVKRCKPERGDILYTKVGATYGYAAINNLDYEFSIYVSLCLLKFPQALLLSKYLEYCLNSHFVYKQAQDRIKGIGRPDLHLEEIRDFHLAICSVDEQHQIVQEIESRLSVCDKLEETITESLHQAGALRQSILKKAFEGKLVPQDPNDEPASVLLERIRKEQGGREDNHRRRQNQGD